MAIDNPGPFIVALAAIVAGTIIAVAKMFFGRHRSSVAAPPQLDAIEQRLARLEQAVDAIAVETERISEGQRFATKLLADRARAPSP